MANVNRPKGLSPVQNGDGTQWSSGATLFAISLTDTTSTYAIGDIVMAAAGSDADGVPNCTKWLGSVAVATLPLGVIVGIRVADPGTSLVGNSLALEKLYIPANPGVTHYVYVCTDPGTVYEIQGDSTLWAAATHGNLNTNVTITQAQTLSNSAPYSSTVASSPAATNNLPLQVFGIAQRPDNAFGAYCALLVRFNVHNFYGAATGRTGV